MDCAPGYYWSSTAGCYRSYEDDWNEFFTQGFYPMAKSKTTSFAAKLAENQENWDAAQEEAAAGGLQDFSDLPDGKYKAALTGAVVGEYSDGGLYVRWENTILEGEHEGAKQSSFDAINTPENMVYLSRKLSAYGNDDPESVKMKKLETELAERVASQEHPVLIQIKTWMQGQKQGVNVFVNKILTEESLDDYAEVLDAATDASSQEAEVEQTWEEFGAEIDEVEDESTEEAVASIEGISEAADQVGLDPNEYATWKELGTAIDGLAEDTEPEEPEEPEEENGYTKADLQAAHEDGTLLDLAKEWESGLDADEYAEWDEYIDALAEEFEIPDGESEGGEEDGEGEEGELVIGSRVCAAKGGKEVEGEVVEIDEDEETVTVKPKIGRKFTVGVDAIELLA